MVNVVIILLIVIAAIILILAILVDLLSLYLNLRKIKIGRGPSGIPGLSFLIYWGVFTLGCVNILKHEYRESVKYISIFTILFIFHISCHFIIPIIYRSIRMRDN